MCRKPVRVSGPRSGCPPGARTAAPRPARCNCAQAARPGAGHPGRPTWCAPADGRVTRGWRAGLVIWGSASRHLADGMAVFCNATGRREHGEMEGEGRGRSKPGWDGNKANSKAGNKKEAVRVISGGRLPPGLPASCPHQPPHSPPTPYPAPALPFYSERHTGCARVLFVTVRQRGLSGSWPPRPAAAVALPGPGAPLASG